MTLAHTLPTLLTSRAPLPAALESLKKHCPVSQSLQKLPVEYALPVRVHNTFIDTSSECSPLGAFHLRREVSSCPSRCKGMLRDLFRDIEASSKGVDEHEPTRQQRADPDVSDVDPAAGRVAPIGATRVPTLVLSLAEALGTPTPPPIEPRPAYAFDAPTDFANATLGPEAPSVQKAARRPAGTPLDSWCWAEPSAASGPLDGWCRAEHPTGAVPCFTASTPLDGWCHGEHSTKAVPCFAGGATTHDRCSADFPMTTEVQTTPLTPTRFFALQAWSGAPASRSGVSVVIGGSRAAMPAAEAPAELELQDAPLPPQVLTPECPELPSAGSADHDAGRCKPCAFFHTRTCTSGRACQFCHLCGPEEKKRRRKAKLELLRTVPRPRRATRQA